VFECLGVQDVVVKSQGSNNPNNMVRAAFLAFSKMNSPKTVAARRGKSVSEIIAGRDGKKFEENTEAAAEEK
jgi:small subunit ribosomal protein S5